MLRLVTRARLNRCASRCCAALVAIVCAWCVSPLRAQDAFQLYFNGSTADAGLLGGAGLGVSGDFWLIGFGGEQRIRHLVPSGDAWLGTDSVVTPELALFHRADDLPAGNANTDWGGQIGGSANALLLNPAPLTIQVPTAGGGAQTVEYPAGTLAFIADAVGIPVDPTSTSRPDLAKKLYRYDLRTTASPTTALPDYATARPFAGGPVIGAPEVADWNDVFQPVVSEQDLRDLSGNTGSDNFGRQFAWSSDGQWIYAVDASNRAQGGIYRIDPTRWANQEGGITRILDNTFDGGPEGAFSVRSEPAVVATSVFDYAPGNPAVGDQIVVEGSYNTGNAGGVNVYVDQGGDTLAAPTTLFTEADFRGFADYFGESAPRYVSIADDPAGNLYMYEQQTDMLFRYDTQGRFSKVASEREHNLFQEQITGNFGNDDMSNISVRTSTAPGFEVTELVYVDSSINAPIGLLDFKPGDFDRDNDLDADDLSLFAAALGPRNTAADDELLRFDLNGNTVAFRDVDNEGLPVVRHTSNGQAVVDWGDVKTLQQFAMFPDGDANFDFTLDLADLDAMAANYHTLPGVGPATWAQGDFASIDPGYLFDAPDANRVDEVDLAVIADAWVNGLGLAAPAEEALSARYSGQFLADAIAAFDAVSGGLPGDYDRDGDVDRGDYLVWVELFGQAGSGLAADGTGDGLVNAADYTVWRDNLLLDPLSADFNSDGRVDAADYTLWRDNQGQSGPDPVGDADGSRTVDSLDYDRWAQTYGAAAGTSLAVPEPTAAALALAAWLLVPPARRPDRCG
ncbi:hypothetical protein [Botrimarina sp.]|uniref:hypothetical protein n=1 Tax=Botrimarina sp. TaxID=2795802 RepID=UPI0032EF08CC